MGTREPGIHLLSMAVVLVIGSAPARAQTDLYSIPPGPTRLDVSGSTGLRLSTDWSDLILLGSVSPASGALEQLLARDLVVEPGPVFDLAVTYWEGRYGFRVHGGFARSCLAVGRGCGGLTGPAGDAVGVDAWTYDVGGAIGLVDYARNRWAWPFVFIGVGAVTYDLERTVGPPLTFIERPPPSDRGQTLVVLAAPRPLAIVIDELGLETKLALNVGVGTDLRLGIGAGSVGLRLEVSDHIHASPVQVRLVDPEAFIGAGGATRLDAGYVHNLRAAAGLVVQFGR
ncbi:MAG: hypothetical protein HYY76_15605 [Acidobacteria bacterium]|nr:hypothetical protein [Acidobacteriota bacterium]